MQWITDYHCNNTSLPVQGTGNIHIMNSKEKIGKHKYYRRI